MTKPTVLIVDDEPINLSVLKTLLSPAYSVKACKSGKETLRVVDLAPRPDLVLLDIVMPGMDGYDTLTRLRADTQLREIPVIFISSLDSTIDEEKGFQLGAVDYITKPFRPAVVLERVRVHLELKQSRDQLRNQNKWLEEEVERRVQENLLIQDATLNVITQLVETRDNDTANHIIRTQAYVEVLARHLQKDPRFVGELEESSLVRIVKAAPLHDIGKIGISDTILLKPGKLTSEEFEIMKTHCRIGGLAIRSAMEKVLFKKEGPAIQEAPLSMTFFEVAENIATCHHEKWDGSGYPQGLAGDRIPLSARLMALADVFDALTTPRVYKSYWSVEEAVEWIQQQRGMHFDPDVVDAFLAQLDAFRIILRQLADSVQ